MAIAVTAMAFAAGCSASSTEDESDPTIACHGEPSPVVDEVLVKTLARYGFELLREDFCPGGIGPTAMYATIPDRIFDAPQADVIFASDGQVWCELYRHSRYGSELRRKRLPEDEVAVRVLNVECRIYAANPWHIERLALAVKQLPKLAP